MNYTQLTTWNLVGLAKTNADPARREFALRYERFVRRVLAKRWFGTAFHNDFDDAVQDVFVECFKSGGVIEKADPQKGNSFRTLLYRVVVNVAARFERSHSQASVHESANTEPDKIETPYDSGFQIVAQEEVTELVREALRRMLHHPDSDVRKRGQLLDWHTGHNEKIIDLAGGDPEIAERLHREHTKAKKEWRQFLVEVVQSEYRVATFEARIIVADLLAVFQE